MDMAAAEGDLLDLVTVKEFIQKVSGFGFESAKDPIFEWRLTIPDPNIFQSRTHFSDSFVITNGDVYGQLKLRYSRTSGYQVSLLLTDLEKNDIGIHQLDPLQFFVCNVKTNYNASDGKHYDHCVLNLNADLNDELSCAFNVRDTACTNLKVELYEETFVTVNDPWPFGNVAVGKIQRFSEKMLQEDSDDILSISPTFHFEASNLLVMVQFSKVRDESTTNANALSATLHILGASGISELPQYYVVTFTIFSQRKESKVKDLVRKVFFFREENKNDFSTLLAYHHDLIGCHDDGHLYYKVLVETHPTK